MTPTPRTFISLLIIFPAAAVPPTLLLGDTIPETFDWEKDFNTLPGSESIYAGIAALKKGGRIVPKFTEFPSFVDVSLQANCDVLPPKLPVDFIFRKVLERFNMEEPGMMDIEPEEVFVIPENEVIAKEHLNEAPIVRRYLRTGAKSSSGAQVERQLNGLVSICPVLKNAKNWKMCVKNKCKGSGRRRLLGESDSIAIESSSEASSKSNITAPADDQEEPVPKATADVAPKQVSESESSSSTPDNLDGAEDPEASTTIESMLEAAKLVKETAEEIKQAAIQLNEEGKHDAALLLSEKAALMEEKAAHIESTVATLQTALLQMSARDKETHEKQAKDYEEHWAKAVAKLGHVEDKIKSVGKIEDDLNEVVGWFSSSYGCELGVVVQRLD